MSDHDRSPRQPEALGPTLVRSLEAALFRGDSASDRDAAVVVLCQQHPEHAAAIRRWVATVAGLGDSACGDVLAGLPSK
jgi:hypothetical protein